MAVQARSSNKQESLLFNDKEMGNPFPCNKDEKGEVVCKYEMVEKLKNIPEYRDRFKQAFRIDITTEPQLHPFLRDTLHSSQARCFM